AIKRWRAVIDRTDGTMTEFRAAYAIAHLSRYSRDKDLRAYGTKLLKSLADSKANNHFTRTATIVLAMECAREGKRDEAIRLLKRIDQKDKAAHELASQLIANG